MLGGVQIHAPHELPTKWRESRAGGAGMTCNWNEEKNEEEIKR
jgi:hypothetical protein